MKLSDGKEARLHVLRGANGEVLVTTVEVLSNEPPPPVKPPTVHLARFQCYDEDETWCGDNYPEKTRSVDEATCDHCLEDAYLYGKKCFKRFCELGYFDPDVGLTPVS